MRAPQGFAGGLGWDPMRAPQGLAAGLGWGSWRVPQGSAVGWAGAAGGHPRAPLGGWAPFGDPGLCSVSRCPSGLCLSLKSVAVIGGSPAVFCPAGDSKY